MAADRYVMIESAAAHAARFQGAGAYEGAGLYRLQSGYAIDLPQRPIEQCRPYYQADCPEHVAPGGTHVTSHSTRREMMRRNGWVDWEPLQVGSFARRDGGRPHGLSKGGGYINEKFARKRGRKTSEAAQEWMAVEKVKKLKKAGLYAG